MLAARAIAAVQSKLKEKKKNAKRIKAAQSGASARDLAARAAIARLGGGAPSSARDGEQREDDGAPRDVDGDSGDSGDSSDGSDDSDIEEFAAHAETCACRGCAWDKLFAGRQRKTCADVSAGAPP